MNVIDFLILTLKKSNNNNTTKKWKKDSWINKTFIWMSIRDLINDFSKHGIPNFNRKQSQRQRKKKNGVNVNCDDGDDENVPFWFPQWPIWHASNDIDDNNGQVQTSGIKEFFFSLYKSIVLFNSLGDSIHLNKIDRSIDLGLVYREKTFIYFVLSFCVYLCHCFVAWTFKCFAWFVNQFQS